MYGEGRSAGFELSDTATGDLLFTMDVDVNRLAPKTKIYEVNGIRFCGAAPSQMIADKISVISTDKVFRRIKDVVDLYYISKVFAFNKAELLEALKKAAEAWTPSTDFYTGRTICTTLMKSSAFPGMWTSHRSMRYMLA